MERDDTIRSSVERVGDGLEGARLVVVAHEPGDPVGDANQVDK